MESAKITTDTVSDKAEATQLFTFQNDRGKKLTNLEKLKALLMLQVYLSCKGLQRLIPMMKSHLLKEFERIYLNLEKIDVADEDQILEYHTIAFLPTVTMGSRLKKELGRQKSY